ncbi:MAG: polymer-forming cytoskeletal protein [Acidobacteriota bacterium]|nr:polymer-forming cytoskeletal protein [Acidobacteriota bacterium]
MAIFRRDNPSPESSTPPRPRPPRDVPSPAARKGPTHIAAGSRVVGEITGDTEVLVDGQLEGRIQLDSSVTIGREGQVKGEVEAMAVRIEGTVHGNVRGRERVEVLATGSLEGDISAARVVIAEGAFFKGGVDMNSAGRSSAPKGSSGGGQAAGSGGSDSQAQKKQAQKPGDDSGASGGANKGSSSTGGGARKGKA